MSEDGSKKRSSREKLDVCQGPSFLERQLDLSAPTNQPASGKPKIGPVPPSSVLDKLKQFMPRMHEANQQLEQQLQSANPRTFDIEEVQEGQEGGYIEMDLTCGLLDLKSADAIRAAEQALANGQSVPAEGEEEGSSSSSESGSSSDDESNLDEGQGTMQQELQQSAEGQGRRRWSVTAGGKVVASTSEAAQPRQRLKAKRTNPKISEL